jgi:hypothetical protein
MGGQMLTRTQDNEKIIERVAALDIAKAEVVCCARIPIRIIGAGGYKQWIPTPR